MSTYVEQSLGSGETLVAKAHFSVWYTVKAWLALIFLGWLLIGIWIFVVMMIRRATTEIAVTSHRFVEWPYPYRRFGRGCGEHSRHPEPHRLPCRHRNSEVERPLI
jgi:hypothetical protein